MANKTSQSQSAGSTPSQGLNTPIFSGPVSLSSAPFPRVLPSSPLSNIGGKTSSTPIQSLNENSPIFTPPAVPVPTPLGVNPNVATGQFTGAFPQRPTALPPNPPPLQPIGGSPNQGIIAQSAQSPLFRGNRVDRFPGRSVRNRQQRQGFGLVDVDRRKGRRQPIESP